MYLVVAPVAAVRRRLTALLEEWPEHPLLEQLAEICDRVLALPLLSPLKQALTGLELLLARAQTWEEGAASHVSLAEELTACAKLALRWRQRELRTWPRLLARAAERHAQRAHRTWFALHRLLRPPAGIKKKARKEDANADEENAAAELDARGLDEEEAEGLRQVTLALEEYVQGSTIGEFRARLDLLWQFHADMAVERRSIRSAARGNGAREAALSNVLYNTWRYYVQFLPAVARQVEAARAPCAQKLRDHAKLAKWEDRGYHAMKTQGEANQRSLHKFVRAFDVSLNALVLPVLQATNGKVGLPDLPSERGAAEVAAASAAAAQTAKEAKNAAIEAKNKAARDAREKHKASSAGLYKNETVEERARREVDEEEAEKEYQREAEAARKRAVAEAARRASTAAEVAAERMREEARADARQSWLDLTSSVVADASNAARAIELASAAFHPGSPASAMAAPLRLDEESLYQSRLPALAKRLGEVLGSSLAGAPPVDSTTIAGQHGADDVDELASTIAARATALRDDKTAKKAVKKKALTDLLRALPKFGIQSARKYVPDSERSPSAWFREAPLPRPTCLDSLGPIAEEAFDAADAYYYRSMARVQRLRTVRGAAHSDLSSREVDVACGSVEHLLHILRRQRRNVADAARVERGLATLAEGVVALQSLGGSEPPPPQERTKRWLLSQRSALDAICESVAAARLVHKTVSAAESTPGLKPGGGGGGGGGDARRRRRGGVGGPGSPRRLPGPRHGVRRGTTRVPRMPRVPMTTPVTGLGPRRRSSPRTSRRRSRLTLTSCERRLRRLKPRLTLQSTRSNPRRPSSREPRRSPGGSRFVRCCSTRSDPRTRSRRGRSLPRSRPLKKVWEERLKRLTPSSPRRLRFSRGWLRRRRGCPSRSRRPRPPRWCGPKTSKPPRTVHPRLTREKTIWTPTRTTTRTTSRPR